jgi:signal transduction histidine kinase/ligand-binding sensor domain-containing protein/DNA-binding NarL/FixJ family response regulator
MKRFAIVFLSSLLCFQLWAADLPVKYIGIEQGLSNNVVTSIYQDYNGFMWFGTYDGLNRYDGYGFKIFRNKIGDKNSLGNNNIYTIEGDSKHNLWVGGQKGASVYSPVQSDFSALWYYPGKNKVAELLIDEVQSIKAIQSDIMLVGTQHNGLLLYLNQQDTGRKISLEHIKGTTNYMVRAIEYDRKQQRSWVFVQHHGLFMYDHKKTVLVKISDSIKQGNTLKTSANGDVWLGTDNGVFKYSLATKSYEGNYLPVQQKIVNLTIDKKAVLWIASDGGGVWLLPSLATTAHPFLSEDGKALINSNAVYSIYEDTEGRKWIGTLRGGVNMVESRTSPFTHVVHQSDGTNNTVKNFILTFCEDKQHNLWIGTDGAGLRYWNRTTNETTDFVRSSGKSNSISSNFITGVTEDINGDVWIATWFGGINRFNWATKTFQRFPLYNPSTQAVENNTWFVYKDRQHRIWASATNDGSFYLFDRLLNKFELFDPSILNLQSIAEDSDGNFWGGNYSSLIKIDRTTKKHRVFPLETTVRCIYEDRRKNFWLGTQGSGLLLFDRQTGKYKSFTTTDGLPSNTILRILEDKRGDLWLSTFNGLTKFDPDKKVALNYSQSDGLQSNQFSFNAGLALQSGEFLFGGIKGFNIFYPDSTIANKNERKVFLTGLKINNNPIEEDASYISKREIEKITEITLPFNKAALSLDFLGLDYSSADKIMYAYYLEGWDKVWNYSNNIRTANYTRLSEGNYKFKVKVAGADGEWKAETLLLNVIVLPPWYRSWWAYLLYIAFAAGMIYLYIRYTKRQERLSFEIKLAHLENEKDKEVNERKLNFFTNVSHEFRTPLTLIINPLKEMLSKDTTGDKKEKELNIVYRNARRLLSLVDQLLLFRKADSGADTLKIAKVDIVELSHEVYHCFIQQAKAHNIFYQFENNIQSETLYLFLDKEKIEIALFNLLSNAFKFTPDDGSILLQLNEANETVELLVKDSGCGIAPGEAEKIFEKFQQTSHQKNMSNTGFGIGLYLVKHFVTWHQGAVNYESAENEGTTFYITLKKGQAHLPQNFISNEVGKQSGFLNELTEETFVPQAKKEQAIKPKEGKVAEEVVTNRRSVLLIDDDDEIRRYLQGIFEERFLVYTAENGEVGFRLANEVVPDLIISDVNMPVMNGVELCSAIKNSNTLSHIPVILLTAETANDTQLKGIEGGADDYITKPFDVAMLLAKVDTILKNRNLLQQYFFENITLKETSVKVPAEYQEFLKKCIHVVEENIDTDDFTIKKFAQAMGMSRSSLYQKVRSISGQSLNAFVRSIRLRRAAVLMLTGNMNINQAAFQVGIADAKYFREQFVKLFGMNPSEYISKYRNSFNRDFNIIKQD